MSPQSGTEPTAALAQPETRRPTTRQKFGFWLVAGMLSVVCVEVPCGSTMFPFLQPDVPFIGFWGILVVWPLYLLHMLFLAGVVFKLGRPTFWSLYAAGLIFGMYEAYITKVVWTSFNPGGPWFSIGGIALFETMICVLFLHPLLAFVIPLLLTELLLTRSNEVFEGMPRILRSSICSHPRAWVGSLVTMFGLMQFVNSPSVFHSLASGLINGIIILLVVWRWRDQVGPVYSLRELLPGPVGLRRVGWGLFAFYVFWMFAIKPESVPKIIPGHITVWAIYALFFWLLHRCLRRSLETTPEPCQKPFEFSWRGLALCFAMGTVVTTCARAFLIDFKTVQYMVFFSFYVIAGSILLAGTIRYAVKSFTQLRGNSTKFES